jgi:hypothetical protein
MKTINVSMTAELTSSEILEALVTSHDPKEVLASLFNSPGVLNDYMKRHRSDVTKAVTGFLSRTQKLQADKVIYQNGKVLVEAHTAGYKLPSVPQKLKEREAPAGHTKPNVGVFEFLREYFTDERKNKRNEIKFEDILKDVQFFFPKLTGRLLQIYLHDDRQLKNIDYSAKRGTVILK